MMRIFLDTAERQCALFNMISWLTSPTTLETTVRKAPIRSSSVCPSVQIIYGLIVQLVGICHLSAILRVFTTIVYTTVYIHTYHDDAVDFP